MSKELDKLPDKWYIRSNKHNYEVIKKWAGFDWWTADFERIIFHTKTWLSKIDSSYYDYSEISFDQFKKWVLKEEPKFEVGDYVITSNYSNEYNGRLLKITKIVNVEFCYFEVFDGGYFGENHNFSIGQGVRHATQQEIDDLIKKDEPMKFEFNRWYKCTSSGFSKCLTFIIDEHTGYGFDKFGNWYDEIEDDSVYNMINWVWASNKEVEVALLNYAKKKYPVGTTIIPSNIKLMKGNPKNVKITDIPSKIDFKGEIWTKTENWNSIIYDSGQWAEIVEDKSSYKEENRSQDLPALKDLFVHRNIPTQEVVKRSNLRGLKSSNRFSPQPINKRSIY